MTNYIFKSLFKHKFRLIFTLIFLTLVLALVNFSAQVITSFSLLIKDHPNDLLLQNDVNNVKSILFTFLFVLIGFACSMLKNIYLVIFQSRINEFSILNKLGVTNKKVKMIVLAEAIVIAIISLFIGTIIGITISYFYMSHYKFDHNQVNITAVLTVSLLSLPTLFFIINNAFNKTAFHNKKGKKYYITKNEKKAKTVFGVVGIVIALLSYFNFTKYLLALFNIEFNIENTMMINDIAFWLGVVLALDYIILLIIKLLKILADKFKISPLFISSQQILYSFKKVKSVIISLTISIFMIVGMLGFYDSVKTSVEKYVDKTIAYDYVLIINNKDIASEQALRDYIVTKMKKNTFTTSLNVNVKDNQGKSFVLTGINNSYNDLEPIILEKNKSQSIYEKDNNLKVFFSTMAYKNKKVKAGEKIEVKLEDVSLTLQVEDLHKNINRDEIYISKKVLSELLYNEENHYNVIYFKKFTVNEINQVIGFLKVNDYKLEDINKLKEEYKKEAINGTEVIEAFLYINVFFTISLITNLFILSLNNRVKEYSTLNILGVSNIKIIFTMIIEAIIIFFTGTLLGWNLGYEFVKGSAYYMKSSFIFSIQPSLPVMRLINLLILCFILLVISIVVIGSLSIKNKEIFIKKEV